MLAYAHASYLFRAITAEIMTEYMYGQRYGFFEDQTTTKGLYDRRFDVVLGLTNLGRFIPYWIPLVLIALRGQIRAALGSKESMASFVAFYGVSQADILRTELKMLILLTVRRKDGSSANR